MNQMTISVHFVKAVEVKIHQKVNFLLYGTELTCLPDLRHSNSMAVLTSRQAL